MSTHFNTHHNLQQKLRNKIEVQAQARMSLSQLITIQNNSKEPSPCDLLKKVDNQKQNRAITPTIYQEIMTEN